MGDSEAEAALLALGEPLKWAALTRTVDVAETAAGGLYRIIKKKYGFLWQVSVTYNVNYWANMRFLSLPQGGFKAALHPYEHLSAAKDACERHCTTGKWE